MASPCLSGQMLLCHAGVLNRAEWIKFLGMFFNQDALASSIFDGINASYYDTAAEIQVRLAAPMLRQRWTQSMGAATACTHGKTAQETPSLHARHACRAT